MSTPPCVFTVAWLLPRLTQQPCGMEGSQKGISYTIELRIVVEKVAVSSQEVVKRDTITSYDIQCPTSIGELGLRHAEQIALLGNNTFAKMR